MTIEGTDGFIVTGLGSPNVFRRVDREIGRDYPVKIESSSINGELVPQRFYFETNPVVEFLNPFCDRVLDVAGSGGRWDGIARADKLGSIYRAVVLNEEPNYGLAKARRDQEISIMITESARLGQRPISRLPEDQETVWEREQNEVFRQLWGVDPFKDVAEFKQWG